MKTLQNNFTTLEQSKKLLELGVPADSADCRYETASYDGGIKQTFCVMGTPIHSNDIPCWSVGRLIEIYEICTGETFKRNDIYHIFPDIFTTIESALLCHKMDFSQINKI